jgi:hypothetical protein
MTVENEIKRKLVSYKSKINECEKSIKETTSLINIIKFSHKNNPELFNNDTNYIENVEFVRTENIKLMLFKQFKEDLEELLET